MANIYVYRQSCTPLILITSQSYLLEMISERISAVDAFASFLHIEWDYQFSHRAIFRVRASLHIVLFRLYMLKARKLKWEMNIQQSFQSTSLPHEEEHLMNGWKKKEQKLKHCMYVVGCDIPTTSDLRKLLGMKWANTKTMCALKVIKSLIYMWGMGEWRMVHNTCFAYKTNFSLHRNIKRVQQIILFARHLVIIHF